MVLERHLTKDEAIGALCAWRGGWCCVPAPRGEASTWAAALTQNERPDALQHIHAQLGKVAFMEPVFWQRKEGTWSRSLARKPTHGDECLFVCLAPPESRPSARAPSLTPCCAMGECAPCTRVRRNRSQPGKPARGREQLDVQEQRGGPDVPVPRLRRGAVGRAAPRAQGPARRPGGHRTRARAPGPAGHAGWCVRTCGEQRGLGLVGAALSARRVCHPQATCVCLAPRTWALTWGGAPSGARRRRTQRWRRGDTRRD